YEALAKIRPAFGGVQTGGNSSAIVDGAAAALIASGDYAKSRTGKPLARVAAVATVGVPPEIMSIGPAPAIRKLLDGVGLALDAVDRFEINEAFAAQVMGVERELKLDRSKLNVNGGAIAIGHPLAATGVRLAVTLARELQRSQKKYGVASACIGGGQGIAVLLENPNQKNDARRNSPLKSGAEINFKRRPIKRLLIHRAGMQEFQLGVMQSDVRG
ncbi:MAG: thiolase family protein, partial [Candidatus Acidiferrales bacterium]